ncbi:MAG: alpha-L-fucosidase [Bacteroidales bacterium]|nr:alpha-L-fucosidase [Bacteroidales bacterium]
MKKGILLALLLAIACNPIPKPTRAQLKWQEMEMNMFCHFGPNTFSGAEWGSGKEAEDLFNPTDLDCRQWAATAKAAGFGGILITAKHHDGFCLWPNPESTHTVAQSSWRDGKGDVLKELSDACREYGIKFGVYISPWDRNDPRYGTPDYNQAYARTLESVHDGRYGDIFEHWFDGACGEGPGGKRQEYDWSLFTGTVRRLQPSAIMFSDVGPDCRWVGNERGYAGETNWSTLSPEGFTPGAGAPPNDTLNCGNVHGTHWIPAEADVSIRPGWFWKESETPKIKSVDQLMDIYFGSVGRNAVLLLNVPPDTRGRIPEADSIRLMEFKARRDSIFGKEATDRFNIVCLREDISRGQRVAEFAVDAFVQGEWTEIAQGTTIGYKRLIKVPTVNSDKVRVRVIKSFGKPRLGKTSIYYAQD